MRILYGDKCRLHQVRNMTSKMRDITIYNGSTIVVKAILSPMTIYDFGLSDLKDLRMSGRGSRGAYFDGLNITWPEELLGEL